jgi:predicted transcriptional regulator
MRHLSHLLCDRCRILKPDSARLTRREREILHAVFALGNRASAEDIRNRLLDPPSSSSVRVMLTRLEHKGVLKHVQDGPRYLYSASVPPTSAKASALRHCIDTFFGGSLMQTATALVRQESWTTEELDKLKAEIERARNVKERRCSTTSCCGGQSVRPKSSR